MANALSDIGRSNLYAIGQDLTQKAIDLRRSETQGAQDVLNMKMQVQSFKTQQAAAEQLAKKREYELAEIERQEAALGRSSDITVNPMFLSLPEETRAEVLKWGAKSGHWNENGIGTVRGQYEALKEIEGSKQLSEAFMGSVVDRKQEAVFEAWDALNKAKEAGDPEKIKSANATYMRLRAEYEMARGRLAEHIDSFAKEEPEILGTTMQPFTADERVAAELGINVGDTYYTYGDKSGQPKEGAAKMTKAQHDTAKSDGVTPETAINKIIAYQQALARLDAGQDIGTDLLGMISPEIQGLLSGGGSEEVAAAKAALRRGVEYYSKFAPSEFGAGSQPEPAPQPSTEMRPGDVSKTGSVTVPFPQPEQPEGEWRQGDLSKTGSAEVRIPPPGLPEGSTFIKQEGGVEFWTNPKNPKKVFKVTR